MTFKQNISAIVKLGRKDPLRASIAVLMVLILPLMVVNTLTQVYLQSRATTGDPNNLGANGSRQTQVSYTSDVLRPGYTPTPNNNNSTSDVLRPGYTPAPPSTSDVLRPGYTPTPNNNNSTSDVLRPGYTPTPNNNNSTSDVLRPGYTPTPPNNNNSTSDVLRPGYTPTPNNNSTSNVSTPGNTPSSDTTQANTPEPSNNSDNDDNNDSSNSSSSNDSSGSSSGSGSSGSSNNSKTVAQVNTIVPAPATQTFSALDQTRIQASCKTGFDRPLIFGVSGSGHQSAYGPLSEKEGGLVKAGSTLATVPINWDHDTIQGKGPQDYNPESVNFPIRKALQTGLVVVVNISGTPNWASSNTSLPPHKAQPSQSNPTVLKEFKELVTQAVRDNKAQVKYWTYWNEPNGCMSSRGDCGYSNSSLKEFAYWHKVFYDTVKAEDPTAKIIFGNLDFTSDNSDFIRAVHNLDYKIEYDYLGLNVYDKKENAKFAINWAKAGYDAQPSDYKKPVWINEWGFDTIWWCGQLSENASQAEKDKYNACVASARQDIVPLVEDGLNKIRDNPWIYAAQYHHLRDVGGAYGLWDSGSPRPGGTKFMELVKNRCDPQFSTGEVVTPPTSDAGVCVVASHDLGGNFLRRGQPITLTSVASKPVKTFKYAFYNRDNVVDGIPKPFCVKGAPATTGCPSGSGQLIVEVNGDNNFEGAMQAAAWLRVPNGNVLDNVWRGNLGWNRLLPYGNTIGSTNAIKWNFSNFLGIEYYNNAFKSTAEIDALDFYSARTRDGYMEIWRNNIGNRTSFEFNDAGDYPVWASAKTTLIANLNTNKTALPGDGIITAAGSFVANTKLFQIHWRGNTEWMRTVPIANGVPDFSKATPYLQTRQNNVLPTPNSKVQAINFIVMPDSRVQEQIWINNQAFQRFIPTTGGVVDFSKATTYNRGASITGLTENSNLTDSVTLNYSQMHVVDQTTGKIPENIQINATFTTQNGTIRDHDKCVMKFAFTGTIDGDVDGNCVNDIYDYNILMQYYNTDNCTFNVAGTNGCRIDMTDVNYLKERFGQKCE